MNEILSDRDAVVDGDVVPRDDIDPVMPEDDSIEQVAFLVGAAVVSVLGPVGEIKKREFEKAVTPSRLSKEVVAAAQNPELFARLLQQDQVAAVEQALDRLDGFETMSNRSLSRKYTRRDRDAYKARAGTLLEEAREVIAELIGVEASITSEDWPKLLYWQKYFSGHNMELRIAINALKDEKPVSDSVIDPDKKERLDDLGVTRW